jgi:hypothetical protein
LIESISTLRPTWNFSENGFCQVRHEPEAKQKKIVPEPPNRIFRGI